MRECLTIFGASRIFLTSLITNGEQTASLSRVLVFVVSYKNKILFQDTGQRQADRRQTTGYRYPAREREGGQGERGKGGIQASWTLDRSRAALGRPNY